MDEIEHPLSNFDDVGVFHTKFDLPSVTTEGAGSREIDFELMDFRSKFLEEELIEFREGLDEADHAKMFDALLDLAYVAFGTAHLLGYPWQEGWERVQKANMAKVRAQADGSDSKRGSSFDVVKPAGWEPPDIKDLLRSYGWEL